jgi:cobalt-zinc-cadmium efflux system membrane fusion protein
MSTPRSLTAAIRVIVLASLTACAGCRHDAAADAPPPATATRTAAHGEGRVRLTESQITQITIEELSTQAPGDVIRATGTVEFNGDRMARILPPAPGQVQGLSVNVGDDVRQGDTLFVLSSREVAGAVADHLASHKDLELAEKTSAMTRDLFEHEAASRLSLQQAENELAKVKARVAQTEEILRVLGFDDGAVENAHALPSRVPIRAPIAGTVIERTITNGQFVGSDASAPLLTLADLSTVWVQSDVFERDLHSIAAGQKADVTTAAYPDDRFSAQVARLGAVVDPQTRTAKMRFVVANPGFRLKPGMFTIATLHLPESRGALTVPIKAIFVENGRSFAYLQAGKTEFVRRAVETQSGSSDRVRVTRGLAAGDRVVTDGVLLLRQIETEAPEQ